MSSGREGWSRSVVVLHWATALVILGLVALGAAMRRLDLAASTVFDLYQWHKSFGFLALALTLAHIYARTAFGAPETRAKKIERGLAAAVQAALFVFPMVAIFAGWLIVSTSPISVPTRVFGLFVAPDIWRPDPALFNLARLAHAGAAYAILALVAVHAAGAFKHHFVDRDDTLARMIGLKQSPSQPYARPRYWPRRPSDRP